MKTHVYLEEGDFLLKSVKQDNIHANSFHPELTDNTKFDECFISLIETNYSVKKIEIKNPLKRILFMFIKHLIIRQLCDILIVKYITVVLANSYRLITKVSLLVKSGIINLDYYNK